MMTNRQRMDLLASYGATGSEIEELVPVNIHHNRSVRLGDVNRQNGGHPDRHNGRASLVQLNGLGSGDRRHYAAFRGK